MLLEVLFVLFLLHFVNVIHKRWKYDLHKIPSPTSVPVLGHLHHLRKLKSEWHFKNWLESWCKRLNGTNILHLKLKKKSWLYINDSDYAKYTVLSNVEMFPRATMTKWKWAPMMTDDAKRVELMLFSGGLTPHVTAVRQVYKQSFQSSNLRGILPKLQPIADQMIALIDKRRDQGLVDFQDILVKTALDLLGTAAFDLRLGALDRTGRLNSLLLEAGHYTRKKTDKPLEHLLHKFLPFLPSAQGEKSVFEDLVNEWKTLALEIFQKDDVRDNEVFWKLLRDLDSRGTGQEASLEQLAGDVATCVIIGANVVGYQLSWILALLASHPQVVQTLLKELTSHDLDKDTSKRVQFDELNTLPFLEAVVREGMRVASAYCFIGPRETAGDMKVLGYRVPKGVGILIPVNVGTDAQLAPQDPLEFAPERWLKMDETGVKFQSMSFSYGPRDCPAERLAMLEMKLVVLRLVTEYELTLCEDSVLELLENSRNGFALEASGGVWIKAVPRNLPK